MRMLAYLLEQLSYEFVLVLIWRKNIVVGVGATDVAL